MRQEMMALLRYANYAKVAAALGVSRASVADWAAGRHVTPARLHAVRKLMNAENAPPAEADGAYRKVAIEAAEEVVRRLVTPEVVERAALRLEARLAETARQDDEAHRGEPEE